MKTCCICLDSVVYSHKLPCTCKVPIHEACATEIKEKLGLACPICRKPHTNLKTHMKHCYLTLVIPLLALYVLVVLPMAMAVSLFCAAVAFGDKVFDLVLR